MKIYRIKLNNNKTKVTIVYNNCNKISFIEHKQNENVDVDELIKIFTNRYISNNEDKIMI